MWALFCPTRTGTPVSRLDMRDSVVDTGTRVNETGLVAEVVIEFGWSRGLEVQVQALSIYIARTCVNPACVSFLHGTRDS